MVAMIEAGEPLYNIISVLMIVGIAFLIGIMCGSLWNEIENDQKNSN